MQISPNDIIVCAIEEDIFHEDGIPYIVTTDQFKAPLQLYQPLPLSTPVYVVYIGGLWYTCKKPSFSHHATSSSEGSLEWDTIPSPRNSNPGSEESNHCSPQPAHRNLNWLSSTPDDICGTSALEVIQEGGFFYAQSGNVRFPLSPFQPVPSAKIEWIAHIQGMAYRIIATNAVPVAAPTAPQPIAPDQVQNSEVDLDPYNDRDRAIMLQMEAQRQANELQMQELRRSNEARRSIMLQMEAQRQANELQMQELRRSNEARRSQDHVHEWKDSTKPAVVTFGKHKGKWGGALKGHHCCGLCKLDFSKVTSLSYLAREAGHCNKECEGKCPKKTKFFELTSSAAAEQNNCADPYLSKQIQCNRSLRSGHNRGTSRERNELKWLGPASFPEAR